MSAVWLQREENNCFLIFSGLNFIDSSLELFMH